MLKVSLLAGVAAATVSAYGQTLNAHPGPANNGGSAGWAMFMDFTAAGTSLNILSLTTANSAAAGGAFSVEVFTRPGSALGGPVGSGPGSSSAGWTSLGTANGTQGGTSSGVSLSVDIPDIFVGAGQTVGVALKFSGAGPRYFGTGTPAYSVFSDSNLTLTTGDARSAPFTTGGSFFTSRAMVGSVTYAPVPEPVTLVALAFGAAGLASRRRRA